MPQDEQDKSSVPTPEEPEAEGQLAEEVVGPAYGEIVTLKRETPPALTVAPAAQSAPPPPPPPPPPASEDEEEDEDEDGMLRMSFLEHLEELRSRLVKIVVGMLVGYGFCLLFAKKLWALVQEPAEAALRQNGFETTLIFTKAIDGFMVIYVKLPLLAALFVTSPWILWQVWAFIAPGLYKKERRFAAPFVICTAGLFVAGGAFAYFVAFRFGLSFLLGIGMDVNVKPMVEIGEYFDLFVNVMLGIGATFELPILIFFLTMLRIVTPGFLIEHSRYAILGITVLAAVITPTPDIVNLLIFAVPMILLYFVGVFAGYLLVLSREGKRFPWHIILMIIGAVALVAAGAVAAMVLRFGYHLQPAWPFIAK
ncbi:MAG: twin-arginine translocase subunit TatC [Bryobacter sp.]|nr:twin-arginine translocase subunit TatC [Bryobacter sp.]